jgi:putative tryptophan/tyrosine transport system substrate-binding protein
MENTVQAESSSVPIVSGSEKSTISSGSKGSRKIWIFLIGIILLFILSVPVFFLTNQGKKEKVYRVGVLGSSGIYLSIFDSFKEKMTKLGYTEGKNIVYEKNILSPTATEDEAFTAAQRLVNSKVDLIFVYTTTLTLGVHSAVKNTKIPAVFTMAMVEGLGLINSISEPGGQITGVRYPGPEIISRRFELLHKIAPNAKRIWVGYDKNNPNTPSSLNTLRPAALSSGIALVEVPANTLNEFGSDLATRSGMADPGVDAVFAMNDGFNTGNQGAAMINKFATERNLPAFGGTSGMMLLGAVAGNSPVISSMGDLAAPLADKIFKGIPVDSIPIVTPEQEVYVNYKVAQKLRLKIPEEILSIANTIIR